MTYKTQSLILPLSFSFLVFVCVPQVSLALMAEAHLFIHPPVSYFPYDLTSHEALQDANTKKYMA